MKKTVLVTGGAGYIGSHIVHTLRDHDYAVAVIDNLSNSHAGLLPEDVDFYQEDVLNTKAVSDIIGKHGVETVIHLAAFLRVEESMEQPLKYYRNNVDGTRSVLEACLAQDVKKLIFSSTGAAYKSSENPLKETDPAEPGSPYGRSKLMAEQLIRDTVSVSNLKAVVLRYFNVAGADPKGRTGQQGIQATHLISRACQSAAGDRSVMKIMGQDYPTIDGTAMRDYIHVSDLAEAHRIVMEQDFTDAFRLFNGGYGNGYSVAQVVDQFKAITGIDFPVEYAARRPGDLAQAVANNNALMNDTGWTPRYNDLGLIIRTAWDWYQRERALAGKK